jgi:large subunit ribosomal protein L1
MTNRYYHERNIMPDKAKPLKKKTAKVTPVPKPVKADIAEEQTEDILPEAAASEEPALAPEVLAKAGKRSAKSLKEVAAKKEKEAKKAVADETVPEKKTVKPARTHVERKGKKYRDMVKMIDKKKIYPLKEAVDLATKTNPAKFDATVELHIRLRVDSRQADQNIRDTITLPSGTGKHVRIAVFAETADENELKKAGAEVVGVETIIAKLEKNQIDFDVLIAPPALMPRLGKFAKLLGPRGLMPSPKSGTVTNDFIKAVTELKLGRVEYRVDSNGIVHLGIGRVSFGTDKLLENANAVLSSINSNRPNSIKGIFIRSAYITTSMGPSIQLEASTVSAA